MCEDVALGALEGTKCLMYEEVEAWKDVPALFQSKVSAALAKYSFNFVQKATRV